MQLNRVVQRAVVSLIALIVASEADACSCVGEVSVQKAFERADAVFAGVVIAIDDPRSEAGAQSRDQRIVGKHLPPHLNPDRGRKITFRVMQWWKGGELTSSVTLRTGFGGGDCGYWVEQGKSYLVYAHRRAGTLLEFGICGRTTPLLCATADIEELGAPIKTYETFDAASLIEKEQPYTAPATRCIRPALLIGERGLTMSKYCRFDVRGVIGIDGVVRDFTIVDRSSSRTCPLSLDEQVRKQVAQWRFSPAEFEGNPVETRLLGVSACSPINEAEYAQQLKEQAEWLARQKKE